MPELPTWLVDSEVSFELYEALWGVIEQSRLPPLVAVLEFVKASIIEAAAYSGEVADE